MEQAMTKAIRVHVTAKKSVTQYEPVEVGAALTWTLPDDADENDAASQQELLYNLLASAVKEQVERLVADMRADLDAQAQQATSELDQYFGPRAVPPPDAPSEPPQTVSAGQGQQLQYAPKADDRQPGQWWFVTVDQYSLSGNKLDLYRKDAKYPDATLYQGGPAWPESWIKYMQADGQRHDLAKPVRVRQQVSEKQNSKGFYYVDVTSLEILKAETA